MLSGTTHSPPEAINVDESPNTWRLCRLAQLGSVKCSNRYVAADVGVGSDVVYCGIRRESIATRDDSLDIRVFYQLDRSTSRERGSDEQHLEVCDPGVCVAHRGGIPEGGLVQLRVA